MVAHRLSPSGPFVTGDRLRLYGGGAGAEPAETEYLFTREGEADYTDTDQEDWLDEAGLAVEAESYPLGRLVIQRFLFDGPGPVVGDAPIRFEIVQTTDGGVTTQKVGTATIEFDPNEAGRKVAAVGVVVPAGALVGVRATYPANYDPVDREEAVFAVFEVVA